MQIYIPSYCLDLLTIVFSSTTARRVTNYVGYLTMLTNLNNRLNSSTCRKLSQEIYPSVSAGIDTLKSCRTLILDKRTRGHACAW